ncbi:uncharacterized protein JCM15063_005143 [Sporobolomyces koalae]|uniref:uncharacterized protein n=1 Tax=Sporobolomyces koalae TaxID=500713 RepID=UPI0031777695
MSFSSWPGYRPGHEWRVERHHEKTRFCRRLGVLEQRFDIASSKNGQSDTFVRLRIKLDGPHKARASNTASFLTRILLAWTRLRAKHPLLAATIHDEPTSSISGVPARKFQYDSPTTVEALSRARESLLVARTQNIQALMDEIQNKYILNGKRVLLSDSDCLARLVFVEHDSSDGTLGFFLVLSHVISDGVSVFKLVNELFATASDHNLPSPEQQPTFLSFDNFIASRLDLAPFELREDLHRAWRTTRPDSDILSSLPLATEDHLPLLPLSEAQEDVSQDAIEAPSDLHATTKAKPLPTSPARLRWIWAITRTLILARQRRFPRSLHIPRIISDTPPTRPSTRWEFVRFDKLTSRSILDLCKQHRQSPSMLLYSMLALATTNLLTSLYPFEPYHPVLVGFPFSARRFLEYNPKTLSDPAADLAIRITFGSIHLPNLPLALDDADATTVCDAVMRNARLAKRQFDKRLAPDKLSRTIFLALADALNTDRLLTRYGRKAPPWEDPKTCINASMIGDVDRILATSFNCPDFRVHLSDLELGTRLHLGEGNFNEGFTFDGQLQLCMGIDEHVIDPAYISTILEQVKLIGLKIASLQ